MTNLSKHNAKACFKRFFSGWECVSETQALNAWSLCVRSVPRRTLARSAVLQGNFALDMPPELLRAVAGPIARAARVSVETPVIVAAMRAG